MPFSSGNLMLKLGKRDQPSESCDATHSPTTCEVLLVYRNTKIPLVHCELMRTVVRAPSRL